MTQEPNQPEPGNGDDNPRGSMPEDSYKRVPADQLPPAERAALEQHRAQRDGQPPAEQPPTQ